MKTINPTVHDRYYPKTSNGPRRRYWLVKCRMHVCEDAPKGVYQRKHATESAALQDRMRLIRTYGGGGGSLTADEFRDAEMALFKLKGTPSDAHNLTLNQVVEFAIQNYRSGGDTSPLTESAIATYLDLKKKLLRPDSIEEIERYLTPMQNKLGKVQVSQLSTAMIGELIDSFVSKAAAYKVIHGFLGYCAGSSKKKPKNPTPWLTRNPADFYTLTTEDSGHKKPVILSIAEVKACLFLALALGDLSFWVWCLFTGMRPDETHRFWLEFEDCGWRCINFESGVIDVPPKVTKTREGREIEIHPNLRKWLLFFRAFEYPMFPSGHRLKFRAIKKAVLTEEKIEVRDLLRHTFISNRVHAFDQSLATTSIEAGNSEKIIKKHYFRLITDKSAVVEYWELVPESFDLKTPKEAAVSEKQEEKAKVASDGDLAA